MSYSTPIESTVSLKDLDLKMQGYSAEIKSKLSWLTYAFGLSERIVEMRDEKEYVYPAIYQDTNKQEMLSLMPSDLYKAFCFWVRNAELSFVEDDWSRIKTGVSLIFFMDLRAIAPTENWQLTKTKIQADIFEALRQTHYAGLGVLMPVAALDEDITKIYEGFSVDQLDNKYKTYPKYAIRIDFDYGFLRECNSGFNAYS